MDPAAALDLSRQTAHSAQAPTIRGTSNPDKAREAAESFEAFFIGQYIEHMFAGIRTDGMFNGGQGEKVFRSLLMQEYGTAIAKSGGIGIADTVQKAILQMQEKAQSGTQRQEPSQ
ncbi:MAG: rod-binding protein [Alphaproteobacteria bacterium]